MADPPIALVAVSGGETGEFWALVRELLPAAATVEVFHVVDEAPRRELDFQFLRRPGHARPSDIEARVAGAEARGSEAIVKDALAALGQAAASSVGRGRPEHEIAEHAAEIGASLVIVGARPLAGPTPPDPASLGHVSRFVVDHAPCPVLVVRIPVSSSRSPGRNGPRV